MNPRPSSNSLSDLAATSFRLGSNSLLVQAAGGNTSLKQGDVLWVKASGMWLREALRRPMFVPLDLLQVRRRMLLGQTDPVRSALRSDLLADKQLRPSIETTLHALMPHAAVLHVHAVDVIAWAVQAPAETLLTQKLQGMNWAWLPYVQPGLPLTRAVAAIIAKRPVDVLVLANHGLVVGGADLAEAEARLGQVIDRLQCPQRQTVPADTSTLQALADGLGWRLPQQPRVHAIATDPTNLARAQGGALYPDHVVFLGSRLATLPTSPCDQQRETLRLWRQTNEQAPPCVAVPDQGLLVRDDLTPAAQEMLICWADVLLRLPDAIEPIYLSDEAVASLLNWDAEKFRRNLDAKSG